MESRAKEQPSQKETPLREITDLIWGDPRRKSRSNAAIQGDYETQSLMDWARKKGKLRSWNDLKSHIEDTEFVPSGQEHDIFLDTRTDRVIKVTNSGPSGVQKSIGNYLHSLLRSSELFCMDNCLEAIIEDEGKIQIVTSQPFANHTRATVAAERVRFFKDVGYARIDDHTFYNPNTSEVISDAHGRNVLIDDEGDVFPIDVHIKNVSPILEDQYDNIARQR